MPESDEERRLRELRELEGKNVAHYQTLLSAWIETRMERDRTLITLSTGAVGLLVTILVAKGATFFAQIFLYAIAFASFAGTVGILLVVFKKNSELIECELRNEGHKAPDLLKYDFWATTLFVMGIAASAFIGLTEAFI